MLESRHEPQEGVEDGPGRAVFPCDWIGPAVVGGSCDFHVGGETVGPPHQRLVPRWIWPMSRPSASMKPAVGAVMTTSRSS